MLATLTGNPESIRVGVPCLGTNPGTSQAGVDKELIITEGPTRREKLSIATTIDFVGREKMRKNPFPDLNWIGLDFGGWDE